MMHVPNGAVTSERPRMNEVHVVVLMIAVRMVGVIMAAGNGVILWVWTAGSAETREDWVFTGLVMPLHRINIGVSSPGGKVRRQGRRWLLLPRIKKP
jgi:hypothetical protein